MLSKVSNAKNIWLESGLDLLVEKGPKGLTIAAACARVNKTKGSFYHHFSGVEDFEHQLMEYWKTRHTDEPIQQTRGEKNAWKRLTEIAETLPISREVAFRDWAQRSTQAGQFVKDVDKARAAHLQEIFEARGVPSDRSQTLAWLDYALYLGMVSLGDSISKKQKTEMLRMFERMVDGD